ncbi:Glycoside hydrolase, family 35 [Sesbania bispinosa]|nr:Glycoside hydrolase, family 35 [Sesbania bispinosa]
MWPDIIKKAKDCGLDAIETYVFWDLHEPARRQMIFPEILTSSRIQLRTDNAVYKEEMETFTTKIVSMCKEAGLFAPQGGPIILAQIENEYGDVMSHYGEAGNTYIKWCSEMALAQNIGVPWIMCKQSNAPAPMIITCNGYYCDNFEPNNRKSPKMFTENWVGWFQKWGERRPHRTAEDIAFSVALYLTTYTNNSTGEKFCFLSNSHNSQDAEVDLQQDGKYYVPAWSVSILQDCKKEVFNTAKVNTQTTVYVKKPATEGNPLKWVWTSDPMEDTLQGEGTFKASELLEQKGVTVDVSDYLWYMTEVVINDTSSWKNATLHVTTTGHGLHAYVKGQYIGAQWGKGPIKLIGSDSKNIIDLSTSTWSYKVGLNGDAKRFYDPKFPNGVQWNTNSIPIGRPMTWYKSTFKTPEGTDSLVLDLEGLGKGHAWVNGQSIGRYWPTMVADENGCSGTCDYRGNY